MYQVKIETNQKIKPGEARELHEESARDTPNLSPIHSLR